MLQQKRSKNYITRSGICCKNAHPTKLHAHPFPLQLTDAPPMRQGCAFVSESPALFKTRPLLPKRGWGFVLFSALPPQRRRGPVPLCLGAKERRLRSFENRRLQSGHDHGPPHDGYFFFAAVRQFLSIRSARTPGMGRSVCAGDADRRDRNIWGCIGQKVEQTKRSQMPQAHAVLPQLVLLHRLDDLVQRRREGFPVLWQIPLELKRVRCT